MVGTMMASSWGDRASILLNTARSSGEISSKLDHLRRLREVLLNRDPSLLPEFASRVADMQADWASPARKFLAEMIGEIGLKEMELIPDIVPTLISFLKDETPAVARQSITTGTSLFRNVLEKVALQGLDSSEVNDSVKSSWAWMLKFKSDVLHLAIQSGIDGVRLLAVRFVEALILLYTPDPNLPSDLFHEAGDGQQGFNITWLKGGHPLLNVGDLSMEASQNLRVLLDQLRPPKVKSLSNSIIIVLISSVSGIAKKRPSFYGRILPVLLSLDPSRSVIGVEVPGAHHALKNAFMECLKCTHSSASPWRVRLVEALKSMNADELLEGSELNNISGSLAANTDGCLSTKDFKAILPDDDETQNILGRKRHLVESTGDLSEDDVISEKKIRHDPIQNNVPSLGSVASSRNASGPVQQLVGMFGALVAQGDKASDSLNILISSITSDLLAEVVMSNMQHLPRNCPQAEEEEESVSSINNVLPDTQSSDKFSLSSAFPRIVSLFNVRPSLSHDIFETHKRIEEKEEPRGEVATPTISTSVNDVIAAIPYSIPTSIELNPPEAEKGGSDITPSVTDFGRIESTIPGLDSTKFLDEIQDSTVSSYEFLCEPQEKSNENLISSNSTLPVDISSESLSPSISATDASQDPCSTSHVISTQYILPKMSVPNVVLTDEQKDELQKVSFLRILQAYKQVAVSGGSYIHFSLLAHLGIEFTLELDSWGLLQKHVLSDYLNHEGHELTLRVLYRLYREAEQDQDFLSSRTATSVYESFLLTVAETLRDSFPASDKSLGRLLGEVPYLSEGVLKLLECLCSPESNEKQQDKGFQSGDRVTQGLSAAWNLILLRPSNRDRCLRIVLQSTVHHIEDVRMKAIRLVANKLFPMPNISQKIEDFADEKLHAVLDHTSSMECADNGSNPELCIDSELERPSTGGEASSNNNNELTSHTHSTLTTSSSSVSDAQRCMSLYFALCTKKHSLLRKIFAIYQNIPKAAKQAVHGHVPILVRTVGASFELLHIISDPPNGCQSLLIQVLQTLTDASVPSQGLIPSIRRLYNSKPKDVEILIPVLPLLSKDEVLAIFPKLVNLPMDKFRAVLTRMLEGSLQTDPLLNPAEVLIAIHGIDSEKDGIPLKKVMDACSACFEQRLVFTQPVLAKVLNQLVEQIPLPVLFMRTVIQAIGLYPALVDFVMEMLSRLVSKQIWKNPKLWVGFLKCALQTRPQSFNVLLQLPAVQLENALTRNPVLKQPIVEHANQPNIRSTLPRSTLVVLGLVNDSRPTAQAQTSQSQGGDTGSSVADKATEVTQEPSAMS